MTTLKKEPIWTAMWRSLRDLRNAPQEPAASTEMHDPLVYFAAICRIAGHKLVKISDVNTALGQKYRDGMELVALRFQQDMRVMVVEVYPRQIQGPKGAIVLSRTEPHTKLAVYINRRSIFNPDRDDCPIEYINDFDPTNLAECCAALVNIGLATIPITLSNKQVVGHHKTIVPGDGAVAPDATLKSITSLIP